MKQVWSWLYAIISLATCLLGCHKSKTPIVRPPLSIIDTIHPSPYLPLYPGSWWEYLKVQTGDTIFSQVDENWHLVDTLITFDEFNRFPPPLGRVFVVKWDTPWAPYLGGGYFKIPPSK